MTFLLEIGVDYAAMAAAQHSDPEISTYHDGVAGLSLKDVTFGVLDDMILSGSVGSASNSYSVGLWIKAQLV